MAGKKWEEQELLMIKENYESKTQQDFMELLPGRSYRSIECMASRLGLSKPSRAWSEEELNILRENYPISTPQEILSLLPERTNQTITHMANKLGILREDYRWSDEEDDVLRKHYDNKTVKDLLLMLPNRTNNGIKLRARKLGLWQDESLPYRKYSYNYGFFYSPSNINCYYGGLLAADGSVSDKINVLRIMLHQKDRSLLDKFKEDVQYTGDVKLFRDHSGSDMSALYISGAKQLIGDLKSNFNIVQNKTLVLQPPPLTQLEHILSFIIGYIDGDGCISIDKKGYISVSVAGTFSLLSWIKDIFDSLGGKSRLRFAGVNKQKASKIWVYSVSGIRAYRILKELQKIKTPTRLARKWNKIFEYEKLAGISA